MLPHQTNTGGFLADKEKRQQKYEELGKAGTGCMANIQPWVPHIVSKEAAEGSPNGPFFGLMEIVMHLGMWFTVLSFDGMLFGKADEWDDAVVDATSGVVTAAINPVLYPYALAGLVLSIVSFAHILFVVVYHIAMGIKRNELPSVVQAVVVGSLRASLMMTIISTLFATTPASSTDNWKCWTIVLITGKTFLLSMLHYNMDK